LGPNQPVNLFIHDLKDFETKMQGVEKELSDCGFRTLHSVHVCTT